MKTILFIFFFIITYNYSSAQNREIPVLSFEEFAPLLNQNNDTVYIINFWATWCRPCVVELPDFEKINANYKDKKVRVILVSLDFEDELTSRLIPFINKKNLQSDVLLLNESDPNTFIDKVSNKWSGAIPASYIYKGSDISFFEKSLTYEDLETIINNKLNQEK